MWEVLKCFGNKKRPVDRNYFSQRVVSVYLTDRRIPINSLFISLFISPLNEIEFENIFDSFKFDKTDFVLS